MLLLEASSMDLGPGVKALHVELMEGSDREPARGAEAAQIWSRILPAIAASEKWSLDFFSHLERLREFCDTKHIAYHQASKRSLVIPPLQPEQLSLLLERFEPETFGMRAGKLVEAGDPVLENELAHVGLDAYHRAYPSYSFCAVCQLEDGSVVILSEHLWATEIVRRIHPAVIDLEVEVRLTI